MSFFEKNLKLTDEKKSYLSHLKRMFKYHPTYFLHFSCIFQQHFSITFFWFNIKNIFPAKKCILLFIVEDERDEWLIAVKECTSMRNFLYPRLFFYLFYYGGVARIAYIYISSIVESLLRCNGDSSPCGSIEFYADNPDLGDRK